MSFASDFTQCLSPLPSPSDAIDDLGELMDFLERVHTAYEASGGDDEMLLTALAAVATVDGLGEVAAIAAGVTVQAYLSACFLCACRCAGSAVWQYISSTNSDYLRDQLTVAANETGVAPDSAVV